MHGAGEGSQIIPVASAELRALVHAFSHTWHVCKEVRHAKAVALGTEAPVPFSDTVLFGHFFP